MRMMKTRNKIMMMMKRMQCDVITLFELPLLTYIARMIQHCGDDDDYIENSDDDDTKNGDYEDDDGDNCDDDSDDCDAV